MTGPAFDRVIAELERRGHRVRRHGNYAKTTCTHDGADNPEALSIFDNGSRVRFTCFTRGCDGDEIAESIGLTWRDLYHERRGSDLAVYRYDDGRKVHRKTNARKDFRQSGTSGTPTLYRASRLAEAVQRGETVYLVEGEEDVHSLEAIGVTATTAPMGARNFDKVDCGLLQGAQVVAIRDDDDTGVRWAELVGEKLAGVARTLLFVRSAHGKDVSDHIAAGRGIEDLVADTATLAPQPREALIACHAAFRRWLGDEYDMDALDAVLAAAAVQKLDGDPLWLLLISGSGNAKTETVQALAGTGATVTSTISSEGALLSATSKRERTTAATGGLLRKIGSGVLVIKDVTSILSMNREVRGQVLGALREVYDGSWSRNVGTDGGQTLDWIGRITVVGAVTTSWDTHHAVVSSMGDRFVLVRVDSTVGRLAAGRQAIGNTGSETAMRTELADAVAQVLATMDMRAVDVSSDTDLLLSAADLVTLARTAVERDYRGDVVDAHAPEMPTRFAKQLAQIVRGGVAVGMNKGNALDLAMRCARDSVPPLRLEIIEDIAAHPGSDTASVRKRIGKPRATIDRELQALHMLGILTCEEEETEWRGQPATRWHYSIAEHVEPQAISARKVTTRPHTPQVVGETDTLVHLVTDTSGTDSGRWSA